MSEKEIRSLDRQKRIVEIENELRQTTNPQIRRDLIDQKYQLTTESHEE